MLTLRTRERVGELDESVRLAPKTSQLHLHAERRGCSANHPGFSSREELERALPDIYPPGKEGLGVLAIPRAPA